MAARNRNYGNDPEGMPESRESPAQSVGMKSLGQLHKSFRDRVVDFPVYDRARFDPTYLNSLGPLQVPQQGSRAGLDVPPPGSFAPVAPAPSAPAAAPLESLVSAPVGPLSDVAE